MNMGLFQKRREMERGGSIFLLNKTIHSDKDKHTKGKVKYVQCIALQAVLALSAVE